MATSTIRYLVIRLLLIILPIVLVVHVFVDYDSVRTSAQSAPHAVVQFVQSSSRHLRNHAENAHRAVLRLIQDHSEDGEVGGQSEDVEVEGGALPHSHADGKVLEDAYERAIETNEAYEREGGELPGLRIEPESLPKETQYGSRTTTGNLTVQHMQDDGSYELKVYSWKKFNDTLIERRDRLLRVCKKYNDVYRPEYASLYGSEYTPNVCTTTYFKMNGRNYSVCNILKGGLNSWKGFFNMNNINFEYQVSCPDCHPEDTIKILQVRHPLERLLSSFRHVYEAEGWKGLDMRVIEFPELEDTIGTEYKKLNWTLFVEYVILKNTMKRGANVTYLHNLDADNVWVLNHWAPIWFTCGVCKPENIPDYLLKIETVGMDQSGMLAIMEAPENFIFPKVRVVGPGNPSMQNEERTSDTTEEYYSQLTKQQVRDLYELYRLDHELFDYSPDKFIAMASDG